MFSHGSDEYSMGSERRASWSPREKEGKEKMCLLTHIHTNTDTRARTHTQSYAHTHTHTHTQPLQRWEERATVTNSFGATKVAGNLSNGTIKLQLSFFSFFIADACILVASPRCNYPSHRRGPCTVLEFLCVSHILRVHWFIYAHCMCEILLLDKCWAL